MEPERDERLLALVEKVKTAAAHLELHGWAVVPGLFTEQECDAYYDAMWQCLERASDGELRRERDYSKVRASELPPHQHGILLSQRVNHARPVREIRRHRLVYMVFALLYGTDQLLCSLDRINFQFPGYRYRSQGDWPHIDQAPRRLGRLTVQSYINLLDASADDAPGNRLYDGSHALFATRWDYRRTKETGGKAWTPLNAEEARALGEVCPLVKPATRKGDMLLWDSRTVHSPYEGQAYRGRFVVYVCYAPLWEKARDDSELREKKQQAFLDCRATSHSPAPQTLFPALPRQRGEEAVRYASLDKAKLGINDERQGAESLLFGFEAYDGREGLLAGGADWKERLGVARPLLQFTSPYAPMVPCVETDDDDKRVKKPKKKRAKYV